MAALARRTRRMAIRRPNCNAGYAARIPDRLLIAPQDLRTADPTLAADIYAGHFVFAGQVESCQGRSPFLVPPPSKEWAQALHGFRWLRHLRSADSALNRSGAPFLVADWIDNSNKFGPEAWELEVVAHRVLAWLSNSPLILQNVDHDFYHRFLKALYLQVCYLHSIYGTMPDNASRLLILNAELAGWLCFADRDRQVRATAKKLVAELDAQILPDGGHVSRNPMVIVSILLDLLPLRQTFLSRDMVPPDGMNRAIERMMPMLRFFRHPGGAFAHFNGAGATPADQVATILAYDDTRGAPVSDARFSGYQRVEAGETVLLMDTGNCPPLEQSAKAHAGMLSFELSAGRGMIVINCGAPSEHHTSWRELARSTAAHSTLSVQDRSICSSDSDAFDLGGRPLLCGDLKVTAERSLDKAQETIHVSHDGYSARFGMRHDRQVWMAIDGRRLDGRDELQAVGNGFRKGQDSFAIRFHLHPSVLVEPGETGDLIYLGLSNGEIWKFEAQELDPTIEDSVFLSNIHGIQPTKQLVLYGYASHIPVINWHFERVAFA